MSRLPKSIRPLVAGALAGALDGALQDANSSDQWWEFLSFAHHKLQAPAPDNRSTAAACIRRQIAGETLASSAAEGTASTWVDVGGQRGAPAAPTRTAVTR